MPILLSTIGLVAGGAVSTVALLAEGPAYRFPLGAGLLVLATSMVLMIGAISDLRATSATIAAASKIPASAAAVLIAIVALPVGLMWRIPFGPMAFVFLYAAIIVLHPNTKRGAIIGAPVAFVAAFGATAIFRELLKVDLP